MKPTYFLCGERKEGWVILTNEYRAAPGKNGPHAADWADKPHRLVYDLCDEIDSLRLELDKLVSLLRMGVPGTREWAVRQMQAGRIVERPSALHGTIRQWINSRGWVETMCGGHHETLSVPECLEDLDATDWRVVDADDPKGGAS